MASQSTLDKANAFKERIAANQTKLAQLKALPEQTAEVKRQIRVLNNQISKDQYQFRTDKDLLGLAGEKMSAGDKLGLFGLATGTVGSPALAATLLGTAAAVKQIETITAITKPKTEPEPESAVQSSQAAAKIIVKTDKVTPNILHAYPSYTYGLSLHLLTTDSYNEIVNQGTYTAKHVLVASAGRYNPDANAAGAAAFSRDPEFTDDFYFSNLQMSTIIGMGISNRGTNAISMDFTLIEPYGLTFLDRLLAASNALGIENYLANPYLLQIDFFGATDDSTLLNPIPNISKHIPINILALDIKVTGQGSEYKITAQPFNHQAFNETIVSTPISVEVISGTVGGFFKSSESLTAEVEKQYRADENIAYPVSEAAANTGSLYSSYSYADVLNAHSKRLELTKGIQANRYYFNFDKRIGDSLLFTGSDKIDGTTTSNTEVPMFDSATDYVKSKINDEKNSNGKLYADGLKYELRKFPITQGDSIESIIAMVVRDSAYILTQLTTDDINNAAASKAKKKQNEDRSLDWLKIIPKIKLEGYDPVTNSFIKTITYNVVPYKMNNVRHPAAPQGKATIINASKQYNYIYTGKNDDILDLNIEFNTTYYTALTSYNSNLMKVSGVDKGFYDTGTSCDIRAPNNANNSVTLTPNQIVYKPTDQTQMGSSGAKTPLEETAAEVASSVYTRSGADMITVSLKIVGDPAFIKQDDVFYQPAFGSDGHVLMPTLTPNGSIITDTGEVFVTISFLTPKDIDDNTGLMELKSKYQVSGFSGLYRIIQVDSQFESGKFTQTLQLIRYPNQDISNTTISSTAEREIVDTQQQFQTTTVTPTSTDGVTPVVAAEMDDSTAKAKEEPVTDGDVKKIDPKLAAIKDAAPTVTMTEATAPIANPPPKPLPILPSGIGFDSGGNITYGGATFSQTSSGDWRVRGNYGNGAIGSTPAQALSNLSNSIRTNYSAGGGTAYADMLTTLATTNLSTILNQAVEYQRAKQGE